MSDEGSWNAHIAKVRAKGVPAKQLYVILTTPTGGLDALHQHLPAHLAYQKELEATGVSFAAGPFADDAEREWTGEGMIIVRAGSLAEARAIAERDPMHESGVRSFRVRPWLLNEGSVTLRVTYSDGGREVI